MNLDSTLLPMPSGYDFHNPGGSINSVLSNGATDFVPTIQGECNSANFAGAYNNQYFYL